MDKRQANLFSWMLVHGHQDDVQGRFDIWASFVSKDVEQVVQDALDDEGPVEIVQAGDKNLGLRWISGHLKHPAGVAVSEKFPAFAVVVIFCFFRSFRLD